MSKPPTNRIRLTGLESSAERLEERVMLDGDDLDDGVAPNPAPTQPTTPPSTATQPAATPLVTGDDDIGDDIGDDDDGVVLPVQNTRLTTGGDDDDDDGRAAAPAPEPSTPVTTAPPITAEPEPIQSQPTQSLSGLIQSPAPTPIQDSGNDSTTVQEPATQAEPQSVSTDTNNAIPNPSNSEFSADDRSASSPASGFSSNVQSNNDNSLRASETSSATIPADSDAGSDLSEFTSISADVTSQSVDSNGDVGTAEIDANNSASSGGNSGGNSQGTGSANTNQGIQPGSISPSTPANSSNRILGISDPDAEISQQLENFDTTSSDEQNVTTSEIDGSQFDNTSDSDAFDNSSSNSGGDDATNNAVTQNSSPLSQQSLDSPSTPADSGNRVIVQSDADAEIGSQQLNVLDNANATISEIESSSSVDEVANQSFDATDGSSSEGGDLANNNRGSSIAAATPNQNTQSPQASLSNPTDSIGRSIVQSDADAELNQRSSENTDSSETENVDSNTETLNSDATAQNSEAESTTDNEQTNVENEVQSGGLTSTDAEAVSAPPESVEPGTFEIKPLEDSRLPADQLPDNENELPPLSNDEPVQEQGEAGQDTNEPSVDESTDKSAPVVTEPKDLPLTGQPSQTDAQVTVNEIENIVLPVSVQIPNPDSFDIPLVEHDSSRIAKFESEIPSEAVTNQTLKVANLSTIAPPQSLFYTGHTLADSGNDNVNETTNDAKQEHGFTMPAVADDSTNSHESIPFAGPDPRAQLESSASTHDFAGHLDELDQQQHPNSLVGIAKAAVASMLLIVTGIDVVRSYAKKSTEQKMREEDV